MGAGVTHGLDEFGPSVAVLTLLGVTGFVVRISTAGGLLSCFERADQGVEFWKNHIGT